MNDETSKNLEDDPMAVAGGSNPEELLQITSPNKSNQSDASYEDAAGASRASNSGPANENETPGDPVDRESVMSFDARDESMLNDSSIEMDQSENVSASLMTEPALKTHAGATGRGGKLRFKSRDRSIPVAVIQTDGFQVEIQGLIEQLSGRFQNVAMDMTAKMDDMLRRIDDLERKLH
ncbi:hypothetical protein V1517DRAFT_326475 [Lipomyces orientalis]|uniref:Uncharacterized protein n=1 Tax=Lipomyces orientalis TaxID=1233043 RepID=A0ACC3TJR4_9ASCO